MKVCLKLDGRHWDDILGTETNAIQTSLTSFHSLAQAIGKQKARAAIASAKYHPEINEANQRRCVATNDAGDIRCNVYSNGPLCLSHYNGLDRMTYGNFFRDKTLKDEFTKLVNSPHRSYLDGEQALLRTMLAQMLKRINSGDKLSLDMISHVTTMCKEIAALSQKMTSINEVTPDQIELLLSKVVEVMAEFVPADKLEAANAKLAELTKVGCTSDVPFEPGNFIDVAGETEMIEADLGSSHQQKALLEQLERLAAEDALANEVHDPA